MHTFPQNQIHLFLQIHSLSVMHCLFLKYLLVSNSLIGSRGAKMNILKLGALDVLVFAGLGLVFLLPIFIDFVFLHLTEDWLF